MSSSIDYNSIYRRITTIAAPIQIVLGLLLNIFNVIVLSRRSLLQTSSCTHYFLAIAGTSIFAVIIGPGLQVAQIYFMWDPTKGLAGCKLVPYLATLTVFYVSILLILATFDRFCKSSARITLRRWSSITVARRAIIILAIVLPIIFSPLMIIWYINDDYGGICLPYTNTVSSAISITQAILADCLPPIIMAIFGILTILNVSSQRHRIAPVGNIHTQRRSDMQLLRMLLFQVISYIVFFVPIGSVYSYGVISSGMQTEFGGFLLNLCSLWFQFFYVTPFFLYILTASTYRREFINIVRCRKNTMNENQSLVHTATLDATVRGLTIYNQNLK